MRAHPSPEIAMPAPVAFDHIAVATHRIADAPDFIAGVLGGVSGFGGPSPGFRWWHWDYAGGGRIEVLEPDGPPGGFVHRFLDSRGPGIHHVTFKLPSLRAACDRARKLGYDVVGFDDSNAHWSEAFLHPRQAMGIVVQMVESQEHDGGDEYSGDPAHAPAEPPTPPEPVEVVGVRLRSSDRTRAVRQWSELLEGKLTEGDGELCFSWPGSAMRIAVTLVEGTDDASEAIELRAERDLELPEQAHPVLGARFVQLR
jgi:methylmalonyl-CoA/ethylmalonyl-CoA epimerase